MQILDLSGTPTHQWATVDDDVMGGRSTSRIARPSGVPLRFEGHVSLEDGGGFASTRTRIDPVDLSSFQGVALRVRGDGRRYQFRVRMRPEDRIAYWAGFDTTAGAWIECTLPFADFQPTFRGRRPPDAPPLDTSIIGQIGFLIADGRAGAFALDVDAVRAYRV